MELRRGARITTSNGWSGVVDSYQRGSIVAIEDGYEPNDMLEGYRVFDQKAVAIAGKQGFVTVKRTVPARKPGCANPRKEAAAALKREDGVRRTWKLAPAY